MFAELLRFVTENIFKMVDIDCMMTNNELEQLCVALQNNTQIRKLKIVLNHSLETETLRKLYKIIAFSQIDALHVEFKRGSLSSMLCMKDFSVLIEPPSSLGTLHLTDHEQCVLEPLMSTIRLKTENLKSLTVDNRNVDQGDAQEWFASLIACDKLEELVVWQYMDTPIIEPVAVSILPHVKTLKALDVGHNIIETLQTCPQLVQLVKQGQFTKLFMLPASELFQVCRAETCALTEVLIHRSNAAQLTTLSEVLAQSTCKLRKVTLWTHVTFAVAPFADELNLVFETLRNQNKSVDELILSGPNIDFKSLTDMLRENKTLRRLEVSAYVDMLLRHSELFANALRVNKTLTCLQLETETLTSIDRLCAFLPFNDTLVDLNTNGIVGQRTTFDLVRLNKRLEHFLFERSEVEWRNENWSETNPLLKKLGASAVCASNLHRAQLNRQLIIELSLIFVHVLPAYVLLEIVDRIGGMNAMLHHTKVEKIIAVYNSVRSVLGSR